MIPGSFILGGINSEDYKMVIQNRPELYTPKRKVEFQNISGMSGLMPFDEMAYDNTSMELVCFVSETAEYSESDQRENVYNMFDTGSYKEFRPYFDPTKIYRVHPDSPPSFETRYFYDGGQVFKVGLTVKPYKHYIDQPLITITTPGTVTNPHRIESRPIIKIFGTGNVTLTVNGQAFQIQNIVEHISLETELMMAYNELPGGVIDNENDKILTKVYPFLKKGANTISWSGTVSKIEIEPRWRSLA